jgi:hypothetical protein
MTAPRQPGCSVSAVHTNVELPLSADLHRRGFFNND